MLNVFVSVIYNSVACQWSVTIISESQAAVSRESEFPVAIVCLE